MFEFEDYIIISYITHTLFNVYSLPIYHNNHNYTTHICTTVSIVLWLKAIINSARRQRLGC